MHDIDRTQAEMTWEAGPFGANSYEGEGYETYETYEGEGENEWLGEGETLLSEADEMALAAELLDVSNEGELDQFLGGIFKKVGRTLGKVVKSPIGKALGGMIKPLVGKALPMLGGALGSFIPIPGVGTALGTAAGTAAGRMFGLETEGMSAEDEDFEVARRVVRLAADAAKNAANMPPTAAASPQAAAQKALMTAAQTHAPGLLSNAAGGSAKANGRRPQTGRWIRRGRNIVLLGMA
jgi:hypothetical protein